MTKPEPKLTHMPEQIKQKIMDRTPDIGTKLALGMVSKEFQVHMDKSPTNYYGATICFYGGYIVVTLSAIFKKPDDFDWKINNNMKFSAHNDRVVMENTISNWKKVIPEEEDYRKAAVRYALGIIGRKTITIDHLCLEIGHFGYSEEHWKEDKEVIINEIERGLNGLKRQLVVKAVHFGVQVNDLEIMQILPYLKPGTLTYCHFKSTKSAEPLNLTLISETEQWKCAKKLSVSHYHCRVPFEKLRHFEDVYIDEMKETSVSAKTALEMFVNNPTMQSVAIVSRVNQTGVAEYLEQFGVQDFQNCDVVISKDSEPETDVKARFWTSGIQFNRHPRNSNEAE